MQKDDRSYTFFLSRSTKTKIYIRRIEVSKKFLHSGILSLILSFGLLTLGFTAFTNNNTLAKVETNNSSDASIDNSTT